MRKWLFILTHYLLFSFMAEAQDIKKQWLKVLKSCGQSDLISKKAVFFGPTQSFGLGSVWRKTEKKTYNPRFELQDIFSPGLSDSVSKRSAGMTKCTAAKNVAWNSKVSLPFISDIFGLTGIDANFGKAKKTSVTVDNLALDFIKEMNFEDALAKLAANDPNNPYLKDLLKNGDRLIMAKAYRLSGLIIKLDFDPKYLDSLKQKYPNGGSINIGGEKGLTININYMSNSELTLTLPGDVYIAGEFSTVNASGEVKLGNTKEINFTLHELDPKEGTTAGKIEKISK
jgi:hypothetical protein